MKHLLAAVAVLISLAAPAAMAEDYKIGSLTVSTPWARDTAGMKKSGAAFVTITNGGAQADRLTAIEGGIAKKIHLHETRMVDGIMKMRALDSLEVPVGGKLILEPGSAHVMFMGLGKPLKKGDTFPLTLVFEKAGSLDIMVKVMKVGAMEGM